MVNPLLLHTKFLIPRPRPDHLARTRLLRQLKAGLGKKLVLVSAPPGYGKTTLLASLAHQATLPLVWYQLDPADNDPTVFLHYLIQGLHYAFPELGQGTLNLLDDREVQMEQVLMVFLNEVTASLENDFLIILEDYHWISNPDNHRILDFLLEHQPPQMHFLISTRVEPPLSLARLRACGDLVELRTQDLRFTLDEIGRITAHLPLAPPQVRLLEERTEGWAAAPYFTTFYYEWCEKERRDLTDTYLTALRILTAHYAAINDYHRAIATCERMLEVDPLLEQVHCDLMRFWHRLGNRAAVARQYRTLTQLLADELAADPMPETQALYAELAGEGLSPSP